MEQFKVKTTAYEGPLDVLLDLIERRKLFINEISLAQVADDYVKHIEKYEGLPLEESAQFILIASTLLLIKSRSLLPTLKLTEDEESDIKDLERRLAIASIIRGASVHVKKLFGAQVMFGQSRDREVVPVFTPHPGITLENIQNALSRLIAALPKNEKIPSAVIKKVISLEETIANLAERVTKSLRMSFKEFSSVHKGEKVGVIVSFLAMLELVKQGAIQATQHGTFDDIHMETQDIKVPRYN